MPPHPDNMRMKTLGVSVTDDLIDLVDRRDAVSRSRAVRRIVGAVLEAERSGLAEPLLACALAAGQTAAPLRRAGPHAWRKAMIWFPVEMLRDIEEAARRQGVDGHDLVRGALVWATGWACGPEDGLARAEPARRTA